MRNAPILLIALLLTVVSVSQADAFIMINEILADPPSGAAGDANQDGTTSSTRDEFVELFNPDTETVDISAWTLEDSVKVRHEFPAGTILGANGILVVFGGGDPVLPGIDWQVASTGSLSLNNTSDAVILRDPLGVIIDQIAYGSEAGHNQSLTRAPEGSINPLIQHTLLPEAAGQPFSAGYFMSPVQPPPDEPPPAVVPEPSSVICVAFGLAWLFARRMARWGVLS